MRHTSSRYINSIRAFFAKKILVLANALGKERLEPAFATVPREKIPPGVKVLTL
ncbi:hypothetical protein [Pandoraea pulmonicola]|uniref:Uncharacterized protein n=1 Tax=Pandoraea pulmonicola TaxID=93221 RepID=A0AAJ5D2K3_PANPU|nr:hypothetical protein [Pandoraea pulmonicola]SUA92827.1 Uncharacterised protein [Pandoraea pulmonicola]